MTWKDFLGPSYSVSYGWGEVQVMAVQWGPGSHLDSCGFRLVLLTLFVFVCVCVCVLLLLLLFLLSIQRAQEDELTKIRKYYETSKEEDLKLLDKPEQ